MTAPLLLALVVVAVLGLAVVAPLVARPLGRDAGYPLAAGFALATVALAVLTPQVVGGEPVVLEVPWVPSAGVTFKLVLDGLALLFALLILGIGALVLAYSARYLKPGGGHGQFYLLLTLFALSMLGLVLAGDVVLLFVCWELTSVTSFLLIGGAGKPVAARPARQALLVTGLGGLALFAGLLLAAVAAGSFDLAEIVAGGDAVAGHALAPAMLALILLGAFTKSAQVPFHFWLPGAMVAPAPVSTYLHAATMVKAGIYLLARVSPLFAHSAGWRYAVILVGLVTAVVGAGLALKQFDLKALLAYSTVSQLGFITALVGVGTFPALAAATAHTIAHAAYKATLFMVVGIIDREAGSRDIRELTGLRRAMPVTATVAALAALSMAGFPPLMGFVSKEEAFAAFLATPGAAWLAPTAATLAVTAAIMTFAYGARIFDGAFEGPLTQRLYEPARSFLGPAAVTALAGLGLGVLVSTLDPFVSRVAGDALAAEGEVHLAIWHGLTPALALSVLTVAGGSVLFLARRTVDRALRRVSGPVTGDLAFDRSYDAVVAAGRVAGQPFSSASPAVHLAWVLGATAVVGAAVWAAAGPGAVGAAPAVPLEWGVAVLLGLAVAAVARARSRIAAVAVLGAVGFLVAVLYVILGAPDLAITQLLVEVLTVLLAVLVLTRLPRRFRPVPAVRAAGAAALALVTGALAGAATLAFTARPEPSEAARYFMEAAPTEAGGRNVVNTILVDFRALDTFGEITVLAVALMGIVALVEWKRGEERAESTVILGETARLLTPVILALSLYLLIRGHDAPGGGFIAALVAGVAVVLRFLTVWRPEARLLAGEGTLFPVGLLVAVAVGLGGFLWAESFLGGALWELPLPVLGQVKVASSFLFDVGVYVVVLATVMAAVRRFGEGTP